MKINRELPAFLLNPVQFDAATRHLSAASLGVYLRLLCHQWLHGAVPGDEKVRERIATGCRRAWSEIGPLFGVAPDGQLHAAWLEEERQRARVKLEEARERVRAATAKAAERRRGGTWTPVTRTVTESVTDNVTDTATDPLRSPLRLTTETETKTQNPTPPFGGEGYGGRGESSTGSAEPAAFAVGRREHFRRFGPDEGDAQFAVTLAARRRQAAKELANLSVPPDLLDAAVESTFSAWDWHGWSERLRSSVTEARDKTSPAKWLLSVLGFSRQAAAG